MFGHDMSWASFNVLEVMSSTSFLEKRTGYLAAIQSFRTDTEVLMLAENLLKKDLMSPHRTTISLALTAIPHVITPSMANSLLTDLLPRLTHSHPNIRKKTVATLYRLALVNPDTLRAAWPRIKERLLDEEETQEVTAAVVSVICELGWRRPQEFLPLAPRLFSLLVDGNNNWMAIKVIKLFATLIPLEPRLIKKILPPMTTILKTTPAMSLLYECVHGIIDGGILASVEGTTEGDELARLCVGKLRGMLSVADDPNCKFDNPQ
jgi:AP-3 complex subunit delta-1